MTDPTMDLARQILVAHANRLHDMAETAAELVRRMNALTDERLPLDDPFPYRSADVEAEAVGVDRYERDRAGL